MKQRQQSSYSEWLVLRCQLGEEDAFKRLVELWHERFLLYAINRLGDRERAKDATQECLISISRSIGKLSDPIAFPKWSFRILERRCIDSLRKTIKERETLQNLYAEIAEDSTTTDNIDTALTINQLLNNLDSRLSAILRLYYLESLSIDEIAEIYGIPSGTVKSRLFYARKLLSCVIEKN